MEKLIKENKMFGHKEKYKIPPTPGFFVVRPKNQKEMFDMDSQKWHRATIGTLLYLIKLLRQDFANSVRELSKVMDGASPAHEKELKRVMQLIASEKKRDSKLKQIVILPVQLMLMAIVTLLETKMTRKASSLHVEWLFLGNSRRNLM